MPDVARIAVLLPLFAQTLNPSPRELLNAERPLGTAEIAAVLDASRTAIAGKTFRLSFAHGGTGPEVLMGSDGRPRMLRTSGGIMGGMVGGVVAGCASPPCPVAAPPPRIEWHDDLINIIEYTGRPARRCNGATEPGELVIEYEHRSSTNAWTVIARAQTTPGVRAPGAPLFEMLRGATPVTSGNRQQIGGRWARAFVAPWTPPGETPQVELTGDPFPNVVGDPAPNDATETLWIDAESLLPVRWETSKRGYGFVLSYEPIDLQSPAGVQPPDCVR